MPLQLPSFAKINWILRVLGRRDDGFHEIFTLLQTVDLHDTLEYSLSSSPELELVVSGKKLSSGSDNLVVRAAQSLRARTGVDKGARIVLHKRIPIGAGLGGGSSNAALTLLALNQLWQCGLCASELSSLAAGLGSDVPFFIPGGLAAASGRGEQIEALHATVTQPLVLFYPGFEISAGDAYRWGNWASFGGSDELTRKGSVNTILRFCKNVEAGRGVASLLYNDFDAPVLGRFSSLMQVRQSLLEKGCDRVMLCGSGSTLLGLCETGREQETVNWVEEAPGSEVFLARPLGGHQYWDILENSGLEPLV